MNQADFPDGLRVNFDVYGGENSIYQAEGDIMKYYVDLAVAEQGWAVRELHGVGTDGWEPIPLADYAAHLDYIKAKADAHELWVSTPSAVIRYRFARQHCGIPSVGSGSLEFSQKGAACADYPTRLSVILNTSEDVTAVDATQGGQALSSRKLGPKRFLVEIDPLSGPATLSAR